MASKNRKVSIYPDDKDVYATIQNPVLPSNSVEMLFLKHLTLTKRSDREFQAHKFSSYILSYEDYLFLKEIFNKKRKKKETTKGILIETDLTLEKINTLFLSDKKNFSSINNTSEFKVIKLWKKISLKFDYTVFDFSKNFFNGQENLSTEIIISQEKKGTYFIESTNDKLIDKWQRKIVQLLEENSTKGKFKETEISLFGIKDQEKRLKFYDSLMRNLPDFEYQTVLDVYVSRQKNTDEYELEGELEEGDLHVEDVNRYIKKASFKGSKLLDSDTILKMLAEHYHIYKIIWQSKNLKNSEEIYQFEVRFNIPEDCSDFAYSVHGKYENGSTKLSLLSSEETKKITKVIFKEAQSLIEELNKEIQSAECDEKSNTPIAVNSDITQSSLI
jgi:hypothetical protein